MSFGLFLILASVISLAIATSFTAATQLQVSNDASSSLSDELTKLSTVDYPDLVQNTFTVPDPCAGSTGTGISGKSCVQVGTRSMVFSYGFQHSTANSTCATGSAATFSNDYGYLTACGSLVSVGAGAFTGGSTAIEQLTAPQTRMIAAPRPGFVAGDGTIRVQLTGAFAALPGNQVYILRASDPTQQLAGGTVGANGVVNIPVASGVCTTASQCTLGLSVGSTPTMTLVGPPLALIDSPDAGAGSGFAAPVNTVTEVTAKVASTSTLTLGLVAVKNSVATANPVAGSVCLWATFPDGSTVRTEPVCNTTNPAQITLSTYEPNWASFAAQSNLAGALAAGNSRTRYPFPTGVPIQLTVDDPDGSCPYAPGMVGSTPGTAASANAGVTDAVAGWSPAAVCTSFTWGVPTSVSLTSVTGVTTTSPYTTQGVTVTLAPTAATAGSVIWDNSLLAPGAVGWGADPVWAKPRTALGCSNDGTCTSSVDTLAANIDGLTVTASCVNDGSCREVADRISPENADCPQAYCLSTVNAPPTLSVPASHTAALSSGGTASFPITVDDPDDPASTITAAVLASSVPAGVTVTLGPVSPATAHTVTYQLSVTDSSGTTALKMVKLTLNSGAGARAQTAVVELGLYYTGGAWNVTGQPVTAAQGAVSVPVPVQVVGTDGNPYAGALIDYATTAPGVTVTGDGSSASSPQSATSNSSGTATATVTVSASAPAGSYTVTATVHGTDRSVTLPLTVTAVAAAVTVTLSPGTVGEGGQTVAQLSATDGSGAAVGGIPIDVLVTDPAGSAGDPNAGAPSTTVTSESSSCVTSSTGSCTVTIDVAAAAIAQPYTVGASSGSLAATPVTLTVTQVVTSLAAQPATQLTQGTNNPSVTAQVLDGAGNAVVGASATITAASGSGLTVSPSTVTTDSNGILTFAVTAAASAPLATSNLTVTVGSGSSAVVLTSPVQVVGQFGGLTAASTTIPQGSTGPLTVTATTGSGTPLAGVEVDFATTQSGISYTPRAFTDSNGMASSSVTVAASVRAGVYTMQVFVSGVETDVSFRVSPTPTTITESGVVYQGQANPVTFTVLDAAGGAVVGSSTTVSGQPSTMTVTPATQNTDSNGADAVTVTDTGSPAGTYTVTVVCGTLTVQVPLTVIAEPGQITLGQASTKLLTPGSATLAVTVLDRSGAPYVGGAVTVSGTSAQVAANGPTNSSGQAILTFTTATSDLGGVYTPSITVGGLSAATQQTVIGQYASEELTAGASTLLSVDEVTGSAAADSTSGAQTGAHPGSYVGPGQIAQGLHSPLPGSASVELNPVDSTGTINASFPASVTAADGAGTLLPAHGSFTLSTWVEPAAIAGVNGGTGSVSALVETKGDPAHGVPGIRIGSSASTSTLRVTVGDGTHTVDQNVALAVTSQPTAWVGNWTHVVVVVDRSANVVTVYINGVAQPGTVNIATVTGSLSGTSPLTVGTSSDGFVQDGNVDEIAVFPTALTAAQVSTLYTEGNSTGGNP